ncbi:hypothetical protein PMI42_07781 [Bradyrhizobium sp. YR681]|uniref:hypothetical protein n=1 Tax=Bradyrhizobium sp. YR681 TaxID=1144344 RepID=UPI00026FBA2F|nr:hypothetical protein [Bradyrhizobium sp. YR681]EJN07499.1 hypothetical protein PMI42_07781 [Bradyrhizobium sp. YR681]
MLSVTDGDARHLAGMMDCFGQVGIQKNTMFVRFKTAYLDRLEVIRSILGTDQKPKGPFDNGGDSKRLQYELVLVGKELATLENLVTSRMLTNRRHAFRQTRDQLHKLRQRLGLSGKLKIARPEEM